MQLCKLQYYLTVLKVIAVNLHFAFQYRIRVVHTILDSNKVVTTFTNTELHSHSS